MAAADPAKALAAALAENARLKKRLAKLEKLDRGLGDSKEDKAAKKAQRQTEKEACRKAFEEYDLDKSGFIEINELELLATELGAAMDAKELDAANKAIDLSGDGKISFEEFYKWWSGATLAGGEKGVKLALLRARLLAHKGKKYMAEISENAKKAKTAPAAAAAAKKADSKDSKDELSESDARMHSYRLQVGRFEKPGVKLGLGLHVGYIADPAILAQDAKYGVFGSIDIKTTGKPDFVPYLQSVGQTIIRNFAEYCCFNVSSPSAGIARVTIGVAVPMPDPSELLAQLGIDPKALSRVIQLNMEFAHGIGDIFDPKLKLTPAELLNLRVEGKITLQHSLLAATMTALGLAPSRDAKELAEIVPFVGAVSSRVALTFGDVKSEIIEPLAAIAEGAKDSRIARDLKPVKYAQMPLLDGLEKKLKKDAERDVRGEMRIGLGVIKSAALTLARDFNEIVSISGWTRSGLGVVVSLEGLFVLEQIVKAVSYLEAVVQTVPRGGGGGGGGGGRGRRRY